MCSGSASFWRWLSKNAARRDWYVARIAIDHCEFVKYSFAVLMLSNVYEFVGTVAFDLHAEEVLKLALIAARELGVEKSCESIDVGSGGSSNGCIINMKVECELDVAVGTFRRSRYRISE